MTPRKNGYNRNIMNVSKAIRLDSIQHIRNLCGNGTTPVPEALCVDRGPIIKDYLYTNIIYGLDPDAYQQGHKRQT